MECDTEELSRICSSSDWHILEQDVAAQRLLPSLEKMKLVFRTKDVAPFVNKTSLASLHSYLIPWMPKMNKHANINIEIADGMLQYHVLWRDINSLIYCQIDSKSMRRAYRKSVYVKVARGSFVHSVRQYSRFRLQRLSKKA